MNRIIGIENDVVLIGTNGNKVLKVPMKYLSFEDPKVGDVVRAFKRGDGTPIIKREAAAPAVAVPDMPKVAVPEVPQTPAVPVPDVPAPPTVPAPADTPQDTPAEKPNKLSGILQGKKKWFLIGGALLLLIIIIFFALGEWDGDGGESINKWPKHSTSAEMLPLPEGEVTYIVYDDEEGYLNADITIPDGEACKDYIDACREKGFTNETELSQADGNYQFNASDADGWNLNIFSYDDIMTIILESPEYLSEFETDEVEVSEDVIEDDAGAENNEE